jgi:hypothetical protein
LIGDVPSPSLQCNSTTAACHAWHLLPDAKAGDGCRQVKAFVPSRGHMQFRRPAKKPIPESNIVKLDPKPEPDVKLEPKPNSSTGIAQAPPSEPCRARYNMPLVYCRPRGWRVGRIQLSVGSVGGVGLHHHHRRWWPRRCNDGEDDDSDNGLDIQRLRLLRALD